MIDQSKKLDEGAMSGKPVVVPLKPDKLTGSERRQALESVKLIKEKRNGIIKGITCANGSKKKRYLKEGESMALPTVLLEVLFQTLAINACKGREIDTSDVPGAYFMRICKRVKRFYLN